MNRTLAGIPLDCLAKAPTIEEMAYVVAQLTAEDFADFLGWWEEALAQRHLGRLHKGLHENYMVAVAGALEDRGGIADDLEGALDAVRLLARHLPKEA